jgi:DNA-binding protein WhiA
MLILKTIGIVDEESISKRKIINRINPLIVQGTCCKRAYIRGAFLAGGSITNPEKAYHLEFVNVYEKHCNELMELVNSFNIDSKIIVRKRYYVLYLKEGTNIVDLLNIMGAHVALMKLENLRIIKEMRNKVNRIVNCETANLNKTISASVKQVEEINYIENNMGIDKLPKALKEIALLRLQYTDASLKELGSMLNPPVGKSGVNHRFRKISDIADNLKNSKKGRKLND